MASAFTKDTLRSVRHSLGRFLAIAAIVALGTGFYAGLRMTAPDMDLSADRYYDGTDLMDIRVVSTLGLTDDDLAALRAVPGVDAVMGAWEADVMATINDEQYAVRVHSLPDAAAASTAADDGAAVESADGEHLNRLVLVEGRWPEAPDECLLSSDRVMNAPTAIGDEVVLTEGTQDLDDVLPGRSYTIVGYARTPYYVSSTSMGSTTLGSGTVQQFMYVPADAFAADLPLTEAFVTVAGAADEQAGSDAYQARVDEVMARIEALAPAREEARRAALVADAEAELADARAEYEEERAKAEAELSDARAQLDDAAVEMADGEAEMADGQAQLDEGRAELARQRAAADEKLAASRAQLEASAAQLEQNRATVEDPEARLPEMERQWQAGADDLEAAEEQWQAGYDQAEAGRAQAEEGRAQAEAARDQAQAAIAQAQAALAQIDEGLARARAQQAAIPAQLEALRAQLAAAPDEESAAALRGQIAALEQAQAALPGTIAQLEAQRARVGEGLAQAQAGLAAAEEGLAQAQAGLDQAQAAIAQLEQVRAETIEPARAQLEEGRAGLEQARAAIASFQEGARQLADGRAQLEAGERDARSQLAAGERRLDEAAAQLEAGRAELADGRAAYEQGLADYDAGRAEADEQFADADARLADAQAQIDDIPDAEWLVMDRTKNYGTASFAADADRVDSIASVFPLIFFLVAALVALTTMTRMVEEERVLIGTYKALGYGKARITSKYLLYAAGASVAGAAVGIAALSQLLPSVIMQAYSIIYFVPHAALPIDWPIALSSAAVGIGVTLLATWAAAEATLREEPAALMLPRAPKAGKRILLERVRPVWRRLSFSWKVTFRNLFRYKKRLVMTVVGIAGCTALLLTGLGLQDSINDIIDKQYGELVRYNVVVTADDDADDEDLGRIGALMGEYTYAAERSMMAAGPDASDVMATVVVPEDPPAFQDLWVMRTRQGHDPLTLGDDGVILTEKLAATLGVGPGDEVTLAVQDTLGNATSETYAARVSGVMENYVANYVFMGPAAYEASFGEAPDYRAVYGVAEADGDERAAFNEAQRATGAVRTIAYNDETIDSYRTMLSSVNSVMWVLVVAAAALAFIVLYNLTNINITERAREIATLKVLGFTSHEVDMYIYREIMLLSVIGALVGLVLGVFLEGFVITTAEVDQVMFGRDIHLPSFAWAFALTLAFTLIVMVFMRRKLSAVDMVESLKSNE
ncbi:MAG: FtsX-like permease family protein [Eggerthellaceae bacterium]|nr:FtsX-like permease family protein [Eggerthellaceae bacterium]